MVLSSQLSVLTSVLWDACFGFGFGSIICLINEKIIDYIVLGCCRGDVHVINVYHHPAGKKKCL